MAIIPTATFIARLKAKQNAPGKPVPTPQQVPFNSFADEDNTLGALLEELLAFRTEARQRLEALEGSTGPVTDPPAAPSDLAVSPEGVASFTPDAGTTAADYEQQTS